MGKKRKPYKYTKVRGRKFVDAIKNLAGVVESCKLVGISYMTYRNWYDSIPEFKVEVDEAFEEAGETGREYAIKQIFKHMDKNWMASAWWLERQFYEDFGKKEKIDQTITHNEPLKLEIIPPKQLPEKKENVIDITPVNKKLNDKK